MNVQKLDLQDVQPEVRQTFHAGKISPDIRESHDEEKRSAAKLMTGAVVLAGVTAAGIIGHKTGALQKTAKAVRSKVLPSGKNAEKAAETLTSKNCTGLAEDAVKAGKSTAKTADIKMVESFGYEKPLDELAEDALKAGKNTFERGSVFNDGTKWTYTYDAKTKDVQKLIKTKNDGKTINSIVEFDSKTGNAQKETFFGEDGKTINRIDEYDPHYSWASAVKETYFKEDGKNLSRILEYEPGSFAKYLQKETIFY